MSRSSVGALASESFDFAIGDLPVCSTTPIKHVALHGRTVAAPEDFDCLKRVGAPVALAASNAPSN